MTISRDEMQNGAPVYQKLRSKLKADFDPSVLELTNESHMHNVPANAETHFKVVLVSSRFENMRPVQRHQAVYKTAENELANGVHALALHLYTEPEWQKRNSSAPDSPKCLGGGQH